MLSINHLPRQKQALHIIFLFGFCMFFPTLLRAEIEIYVSGQKYDSLQAYQGLKQADKNAQPSSKSTNQTQQASPEHAISFVDRRAWKRLEQLGVSEEQTQKFIQSPQSWDNPQPRLVRSISDASLEQAFKQALNGDNRAKLIIAQDNKVKIMALSQINEAQEADNDSKGAK